MNTKTNGHDLSAGRALVTPATRGMLVAAALMLGASALFALQAALVKTGLQQMAPLELVFFRGLVCVAVIGAVARLGGHGLATSRPIGQLGLGIIGFASLALYFMAIELLPLVTATALNYTAPLFLALILSVAHARSSRAAVLLWVVGGFCGVCLLLRPSLADSTATGVMFGLLSGITGAAAYLLLSRLGRSGEPERVTGFYFSIVVCLLAGIPTLSRGFSISEWDHVGLVLAIGLLATFAQLAVGRAYAISSPMIPATLSYSAVIFSSLIGAFWWGDQLGFWETLGVALIVASGILVSASQAQVAPTRDATGELDDEEERRKGEMRKNSLRSLYATFMLARRPDQVKYVFMMGDAQDEIAESERLRGKIADPFRSAALEGMWQGHYRAPRYEVDDLLRLPADTLGGAYSRHMRANGLRPDFYEDVAPRHRLHYLRLRMRQTHDIWHVLAGFGTDEFGEVGLQGFYFAQFTNGQSALIGAGAMLKSVLRGRFDDLEKHVDAFCEGYVNGKRAESLLAVEWEELWGENIESLRRRFRIELPCCHAGKLVPASA
jgi:ubiquinone biosynthesis protein Coq4/drug/metabolite transporter (DMT)-like permease